MQKILDKEVAIQTELDAIKDRIIEDVQKQVLKNPLPGVTQLSSRAATVSLSSITTSKTMSLSARYYSSDAQANAVMKKLETCKTVATFVSTLEDMVEKQAIHLKDGSFPLNTSTLSVLKGYLSEN